MLVLSNININFEDNLINNGEIHINNGEITAITGESGLGKTTLLYHIGLISSNDNYIYNFEGTDIDLKNDKQKSLFRKLKIGYIFQDNNLIETLTIKENIKLSADIAGQTLSDTEINALLKFVKLDDIAINDYPSKLSGGEKQRLAIACALSKKPELILADEPTSALDSKNAAVIMDIFKEIAHKDNRKVVIATHDETIYSQADALYNIYNKEIKLIKKAKIKKKDKINQKDNLTKSSLKTKFYFNYALNSYKKNKIQKRIMLFICALTIALCTISYFFGNSFIDEQKEYMNNLSDRELFLINLTAPLSSSLNCDENISIEDTQSKKISNIPELEKIYPFFEFRSTGYDYKNDKPIEEVEIIVDKSNGSSQKYSFDQSNSDEYKSYTIMPYFPLQKIHQKVQYHISNRENGIYISDALASLLNISESDENVVLKLEVGIPAFLYETEMKVNNTSTYDIDIDMVQKKEIEIEISGILRNDIINIYSNSGNNVIYMPFNNMREILDDTISNDFTKSEYYSKKWTPSAYILYAKDYNVIKEATEKLKSISPNFKIVNKYQDIESMNDNIRRVKGIILTVSFIILLIVFLLMGVLYMNYTAQRRYEIALLKANGLTREETRKIVLTESLLQILKTSILAFIFSIVIALATRILFSIKMIEINIALIGMLVVISFLSIIIPTILTINNINNYNPDKIMRN